MNGLQIFGFVLITVGTILSFLGSYNQSKKDSTFQDKVDNYVNTETQQNVPELKVLRITGNYPNNLNAVVRNVGKLPAIDVRIIFDKQSLPDAFQANMISQLREIPQGVEYEMSLNLFTGIETLLKLENDDPEYKKRLELDWEKYQNSNKHFIPRFHLEYTHNGKKVYSDNYYLLISKKDGVVHFGKDE